MKAIAISGSPRTNGNTAFLLNRLCEKLREEKIDAEVLSLAGKTLGGCQACGGCQATGRCVLKDDFSACYEKMIAADIIVVGSPVYFGSAHPSLMALLQRAGMVGRPQNLFSRKIGAPVAVARRAGKNFTYAELLFWYTINDMIVAGSTYWNVSVAKNVGESENDSEGIATIERLAENLAWLAKKIF